MSFKLAVCSLQLDRLVDNLVASYISIRLVKVGKTRQGPPVIMSIESWLVYIDNGLLRRWATQLGIFIFSNGVIRVAFEFFYLVALNKHSLIKSSRFGKALRLLKNVASFNCRCLAGLKFDIGGDSSQYQLRLKSWILIWACLSILKDWIRWLVYNRGRLKSKICFL